MARSTWRCGSLCVAALLILAWNGVVGQEDPCQIAQQLHSLDLRLAGNVLDIDELGISDYYIDDNAWYSVGKYVIASSNNVTCGTVHPWHIEGELPADYNEQQATLCNRDCVLRKTATVLRCQDENFVFRLPALDSNTEAYCIEPRDNGGPPTDTEAPTITFKPTISAAVLRLDNGNNLHLFCDFIPIDQNLFFTVEWSSTSGFTILKSLRKIESQRYDNTFRSRTALNEAHLKGRGIDGLDFTVMCSVTAQKDVVGKHSSPVRSEPKYCGIKVLQNENIHLKNAEKKSFQMQLTIPFGCNKNAHDCSLDVALFVPKQETGCELPSLGIIDTQRKPCGVRLTKSKYDEIATFDVTGVAGKSNVPTNVKRRPVFRVVNYPDHPLFSNYLFYGPPVIHNSDKSQIDGQFCYSHNDPHMRTFEKRLYENQTPGTYILYKHDTYEIEVQLSTKRWSSRVSLNCGIAIRAGRDVFVYSICDPTRPPVIQFTSCDDGILDKSVAKNRNVYTVTLPTGTLVKIITYGSRSVNFQVYPSVEDIGSTSGLCGRIDNEIETPIPSQHIVKDNANLFNKDNHKNLNSWSETLFVCKCSDHIPPGNILDREAECTQDVQIQCIDDRNTVDKLYKQCAKARTRRDVQYGNRAVEKRSTEPLYTHDIHLNRATAYTSPRRASLIHQNHQTKRSVYDEASARTDCMAILNTTAFQMCYDLPNLDVGPSIDNCATDAILTNSMEWSGTHLEAIKDQCIHHVRANQPLSAEAREKLDEFLKDDDDNNTAHNDTNSTTPTDNIVSTTEASASGDSGQIFTFTEEFLREIEDVSCPNECSGNGKCINGACVCDKDYIDFDCSINAHDPPLMHGIPDLGLCDRMLRPCQQTSVFGEQIVESPNLVCKLVPFMVDRQLHVDLTGSTVVPAEVISLFEVTCPMPTHRARRDATPYLGDNSIARGHMVSISNDGKVFSDEDAIVVFDSRCVDCLKQDGDIVCRKKPGFCVRDGECYEAGEQLRCDTCLEDGGGGLEWTPRMDCPDLPKGEARKLWIIAAVVVPVVMLVALVTLTLWCKTGRKGKSSSKVDLHMPEAGPYERTN